MKKVAEAATQIAVKPSLGQLLARIEKSRRRGMIGRNEAYSDGAGDELTMIGDADEESDNIAVPSVRCSTEEVFLVNRVEFIAAHILHGHAADPNKEETQGLIRHLNDCSRCFEAYCEIMRDYYFEIKKE